MRALRAAVLATFAVGFLTLSHTAATADSAGYAIELDGIHGYLGRDLSGAIRGCNAITLAAWVLPEGPQGDLLSPEPRGQAAVGLGFHLGLSAGKVFCAKGNGSGSYVVLVGRTGIGVSSWHHVAATFDGGTMAIFVDGVLDTVLIDSSPIEWNDLPPVFPPGQANFPTPAQLFVGADKHNDLGDGPMTPDFAFYEGQIDEAQIWNRVLSPFEIETYRWHSLTGTEPGLVDYWKFDEGTGPTAADEVPANGPLTLYPGATWVASSAPVNVVGVGGPAPATAGLAVFPNPTRGRTTILLASRPGGAARVTILDPAGRCIAEPWAGVVGPGEVVRIAWDGRDREGRPVADGLYLVRSESAGAHRTARLLMLR